MRVLGSLTQNNAKNIFLNNLNTITFFNCPQSTIIDLNDSVKITYKELNKFTTIQLFFEKSKIVLRHNLKSNDHMIMSEPNLLFIDKIINEVKQCGYHQISKDNDEVHSTCRMEFIKRK